MDITVVGTGYVGLTTGATLAFLGHDVTCVDIDSEKLARLEKGEMPFYEPYLNQLIQLAAERLNFSLDLTTTVKNSQVSFITVGTPPKADGSADLSAVAAVAKGIGKSLDMGQAHIVVNKSTVPIGAGNYVESLVREGYRQAHNKPQLEESFAVASNPEFLREGSAIYDSLYPDRIVLGTNNNSALHTLQELYKPLLEQTFTAPSILPRPSRIESVALVTTDITSAETIKYAANAFLATKISFINEVAGLAEYVGADITEVARGIGLDNRIGSQFLQAGIGWGGSCFGKDTSAMISSARDYQYTMPLLEATLCINARQRLTVISKLQEELKLLKGRKIGLLGLSFKPDTDDLRDSPALDVIQELHQRGAHIVVHDPVAMPHCQASYPDLPVQYADSIDDLAFEADALVLVTAWKDYRSIDWQHVADRMKAKIVIDGRNYLDANLMQEFGFRYKGIGL